MVIKSLNSNLPLWIDVTSYIKSLGGGGGGGASVMK